MCFKSKVRIAIGLKTILSLECPPQLGGIQKLSGNVGHLAGSSGSVWDQLDLGEQLQSRKRCPSQVPGTS